MKLFRFCLLFAALLLLFSAAANAAEIYLPSPDEVGDLQTDKPFRPILDESGQIDPDSLPHGVDFAKDIVKPTAIFAGIAVLSYVALRIIRSRIDAKDSVAEEQGPIAEEKETVTEENGTAAEEKDAVTEETDTLKE